MTEPTPKNGTDKLAEALAKAQGEMKNAPLNKINPHFKSKYADLAAIRDATIPTLSKNGLAIIQYTKLVNDNNKLVLVTRLLHNTGQYIESEYPLPVNVEKPQQMGSAFTYAKRYSWAAMVGISADEDDDAIAAQANSASAPTKEKKSTDSNWHGPLKKMALKDALETLKRDIRACTTITEVNDTVKAAKSIIDQTREDLPHWFSNVDAEQPGVKEIAEMVRAQIRQEQERQDSYNMPDADNPQSYLDA